MYGFFFMLQLAYLHSPLLTEMLSWEGWFHPWKTREIHESISIIPNRIENATWLTVPTTSHMSIMPDGSNSWAACHYAIWAACHWLDLATIIHPSMASANGDLWRCWTQLSVGYRQDSADQRWPKHLHTNKSQWQELALKRSSSGKKCCGPGRSSC